MRRSRVKGPHSCSYFASLNSNDLLNDDWLWLRKGRREKLLDVQLHLQQEDIRRLKDRLVKVGVEKSCFCFVFRLAHHPACSFQQSLEPSMSDEVALAWMEEYREMINECVDKMLVPSLLKELEEKLAAEAEVFVLEQCANFVRQAVSRAPYRARHAVDEDREPGLRVVSVVAGVPTYVAAVDGSGRLMDHAVLEHMLVSPRTQNASARRQREEDHARLVQFFLRYRPDVIALGADSMDCRSM